MDCGREKGKLLLNGYRISICDERNGSGNIVVVSGLQHKCNWCPLIVHLNVGKWHILCYISNFPTKKGDSLFQTLQSREVMATSRFHVPHSCKCGLLSPFVWVQILPLLLPVPLGARDSDFGTSVSSSVKRRQITLSLPRKVAMRKLQSPYTVTGTEKTLAEYGSSPLLGELHQSAGRRHGASEGGLWDRCWGESFAALDSDFPRRSQWDGSWRALCPGLSPSGDQRPQRTPWSSAASPLHPLHYRRRENSKAFSNSTSLLLESSPKPWIRLTRHLLIESIYFSLLNSQHTSSHPHQLCWCSQRHLEGSLPPHFTWLSPPCPWTLYLPGGFLWLTEAESHASALSWLNVLSPIATIAYSLCCYCLFSYHLSSEIISSLCY